MRPAPMAFWTVVVLAVGAGTTWAMIHFRAQVETRPPVVLPPLVRTLVVKATDLRMHVKTEGTVAPRTEIFLTAEVSGKVTMVSDSLAAGGFFAQNDVLVRLDDRDYKLAIAQARARVAQAKLLLSREEAEAEIARREWKQLGQGEEAPPLTLHEPQVQEAKAGLAAAQAALEKANLDLQRTVIRAPFAGRVRAKHADVGQFVARSTTLAQIYAVDYAEVRLPLHDSQLQFLDLPLLYLGEDKVTPTCKVTLHAKFAGREQRWEGTIVRTEGEIDPKSRMVHTIARVDNPYGKGEGEHDRPPLAVGMFVSATIWGKLFPGVIEVPRDALRDGNKVLVIDSGSRLHIRRVEVLRAGYETAVLRSGLKSGERICLSPLATVVEGMQVRVLGDEESTSDR